jgi:hypothetical protein
MLTPEQEAKLKEAHPGAELHRLSNEYAEVVVKVPSFEVYQKFLDQLAEPSAKTHAPRLLLMACLVHPPEAEFRALIQTRPGVVQSFANDLVELAGLKAVTDRKKL